MLTRISPSFSPSFLRTRPERSFWTSLKCVWTSELFFFVKFSLKIHLIFYKRANLSKSAKFLISFGRKMHLQTTSKRFSTYKSSEIQFKRCRRATKMKHKIVFLWTRDLHLPKQVLSSSASSRPSGHRQKTCFTVERQMCEQFPLLIPHSPASSQLRPSADSRPFGRRSQEHSKLPQVL